MVTLLLTTTISCIQLSGLIQRIQLNNSINDIVKNELVQIIRENIPTCSVKIKFDGK